MRRARARSQQAAALVGFALAWPLALLIVIATVETAVWAAESYAARAAALAGARAGSIAGGNASIALEVARRTLASSIVGVDPASWCPGATGQPPPLWVCAVDLGAAVEVDVGGSVPALVPMVSGGGLPLHAHSVLEKETFSP